MLKLKFLTGGSLTFVTLKPSCELSFWVNDIRKPGLGTSEIGILSGRFMSKMKTTKCRSMKYKKSKLHRIAAGCGFGPEPNRPRSVRSGSDLPSSRHGPGLIHPSRKTQPSAGRSYRGWDSQPWRRRGRLGPGAGVPRGRVTNLKYY